MVKVYFVASIVALGMASLSFAGNDPVPAPKKNHNPWHWFQKKVLGQKKAPVQALSPGTPDVPKSAARGLQQDAATVTSMEHDVQKLRVQEQSIVEERMRNEERLEKERQKLVQLKRDQASTGTLKRETRKIEELEGNAASIKKRELEARENEGRAIALLKKELEEMRQRVVLFEKAEELRSVQLPETADLQHNRVLATLERRSLLNIYRASEMFFSYDLVPSQEVPADPESAPGIQFDESSLPQLRMFEHGLRRYLTQTLDSDGWEKYTKETQESTKTERELLAIWQNRANETFKLVDSEGRSMDSRRDLELYSPLELYALIRKQLSEEGVPVNYSDLKVELKLLIEKSEKLGSPSLQSDYFIAYAEVMKTVLALTEDKVQQELTAISSYPEECYDFDKVFKTSFRLRSDKDKTEIGLLKGEIIRLDKLLTLMPIRDAYVSSFKSKNHYSESLNKLEKDALRVAQNLKRLGVRPVLQWRECFLQVFKNFE